MPRKSKATIELDKQLDLDKEKESRRLKFLELHPNFGVTKQNISLPPIIVTPTNAAEVLVGAINNVIEIYNKLSASISEEDIKKMSVKERIGALQKLSYIHQTTKKFKPNLNFIKINTKEATAESLESALLDFNKDDNEEE